MVTKEKLIEAIKKLPEGFTIEQVIEELVLLDKIEKGVEDIDQGKIYSSKEAEKRLLTMIHLKEAMYQKQFGKRIQNEQIH